MIKIQQTIKLFSLDQPTATLDELRERIKDVAADWLAQGVKQGEQDIFIDQCHETMINLRHIAATMSLTIDQHKAINEAVKMLKASQGRLNGDAMGLVDLLDGSAPVIANSGRSSSTETLPPPPVTTFKTLSDAYLSEHKVNLKESSIRDLTSSYNTLCRFTEGLNLADYSRAELVAVRDSLVDDEFADTTINKLLTKLSTVISWAVMNGHITKDYSKGLKLRGAESQRKPFSGEQMAMLTESLTAVENDGQRYLVALGAITGARVSELAQLTPKDVRSESGVMVIDINENDDKSVKNRSSIRLVPLTDGAYGFNLEEFKKWVAGLDADKPILSMSGATASKWFNNVYRKSVLGDTENLTFHSLRHSMAGSLKAAGVNLTDAQGVLGHSSQSLAFDLYGKGHAVERLADALKVALIKA
ncbi:site-specific integrase [Escherichia coli]|nr:site-specific integrase [Escherichia coli]EFL5602020.1 site-specific integrase [Escherichia coli]EGK5687026.1 site-specific integrase [Escherichia coli]